MPIVSKDADCETLLAIIHQKYPNARTDCVECYPQNIVFKDLKASLKLKHIGLRAVSPCLNERGTFEFGKPLFTYHFVCFHGEGDELEAYAVHCAPNPFVVRKLEHINNNCPGRYELKKNFWNDCKNSDPFDFRKSYFIPQPDHEPTSKEKSFLELAVDDYHVLCEDDPFMLGRLQFMAEKFIKKQFEDLMKEFHETRNEYHLARADFYRKLKVEVMTDEDVMLAAAAHSNYFQPKLIERKLRLEYAEKIGSL
ncbi:hypothetical protein CRE_00631 [Caenorhabditis remanei]|uniref:Uncharacterized protein n=1 Tax=Caenorhabditis remanei TaxID=31234 RepID=E3LDJ7_CAERE|nr:hypothetical protein CRE_00631 [Caenorhabditis remanei]